jgi:hypothetical protein
LLSTVSRSERALRVAAITHPKNSSAATLPFPFFDYAGIKRADKPEITLTVPRFTKEVSHSVADLVSFVHAPFFGGSSSSQCLKLTAVPPVSTPKNRINSTATAVIPSVYLNGGVRRGNRDCFEAWAVSIHRDKPADEDHSLSPLCHDVLRIVAPNRNGFVGTRPLASKATLRVFVSFKHCIGECWRILSDFLSEICNPAHGILISGSNATGRGGGGNRTRE